MLVLPPPESGAAWLAKPCVRVSTDAVQLLELTAEEGAVLTGVLRDRDGKPAPDMTVMLRTKETPHRSKPLVRITDVSGAYRFKGLKPGRYSISVPWFYKRSARVLANLRTVHVQAGETVTCDLVMTGRP